MLAVGLLGIVLTSGCALGSNASGRAAGAVKDGARRETLGNVASENFTQQLYRSSAVPAATPAGVADTAWKYSGTARLQALSF